MPAGFEKCRKAGGRIRTQKLSGNYYRHVCFQGKRMHPGYAKKRKSK